MRNNSNWFVFLYLIFLLSLTAANTFQPEGQIYIQSPQTGEAVQGLVQITGNTFTYGFQSYELAFSFSLDTTETWFLIKHGYNPIIDGVLGEWDTSVLTDGNYNLRLIVNRTDSISTVVYVEDIRVRNYSPLETGIPTHTPKGISTNLIGATPDTTSSSITQKLQTPPTQLKKNPAEINPTHIDLFVRRGGIFALVMLGLLGLYVISRKQ